MGFIRRRRRPIRILFKVFVHALGFFLSIQAVMQTRTEQGAIAWAIALNTIPVAAVPAWFVFGSNEVHAYHSAMRVGMDEVRPFAEQLITNLDQAGFDMEDDRAVDAGAYPSNQREILNQLQKIASGPSDPFETCAMGFLTLINGARDRIWLATPYFVPDDKIVTALQLAAIRGVDVRVILPDLTDSRLVYLSSFSYFKELEIAGVKIYRYQKGFSHQKVMIIDDSLSVIGSANLDNRSFRLNFEVTGIVSDTAFNSEVSRMLEADFDNSYLTGFDALAEKPFWFRLGVRLARMLAPIQ